MHHALAAVFIMTGLAYRVPDVQAQAPQRIRLGTMAPQGTSYHRILQEMGEKWRTASGGRLQLTIYAGTMGSETELVRRLRLGQLQAAVISVVGLMEIDPAVTALQQMPMMFRSLDEAEYVRSKLEPDLAARLAERGFVVLYWADAGWVRYFTRVPAQHPDDFRKLKVFVTAGDSKQLDLMRAAGYAPVSLEYSDALTALQTGMVDAVPTLPFHALAMQFHTVASNMLELNWLPLVGAAIVSKKTWDGLSQETRDALKAATVEAGRQTQLRGRAEGDEAVGAMKARGLKVVPVPPAVEAEWRRMAEGLYPRIRGELVPAEMFDQVLKLVAEYRAANPAPAR